MTTKPFTNWLALIGTALLAAGFLGALFLPIPRDNNALSQAIATPTNPVQITPGSTSPFLTFGQNRAPIQCTTSYTTEDKAPTDNTDFATAANLSNYTGQSLLNVSGKVGIGGTYYTKDDYYRLDNAGINYRYTVKAVPDKTINYDLGIIVYDKNQKAIITDSNPFDGNSAEVKLVAEEHGPYYFKVFQRSEQCQGSTYSLILSAAAPTATPTPSRTPTAAPETTQPTPTWLSGFDKYEPNYNFDTAQTAAPGVTYNLNFVPWGGGDEDNDFFKVWVKPGLIFSCETFDLAPGLDTNISLYTGPSLNSGIGGNDDKELGDYSSRVSYYSTYEGFLYLLVGHGGRTSGPDIFNSDYKLKCEMSLPGDAPVGGGTTSPPANKDPQPTARATTRPTATPKTPSSSSPLPTPTPKPTTAATPTPTPSGPKDLVIRPIKTPAPVTPTPTAQGFRTFRVIVYYDANEDIQPGAGEGIAGFYVRVLSPNSGEQLAQGYTDEQGQLSFTVPTVGTVQVKVPLLGFERLVDSSIPEVVVRIAPLPLPDTIP